MSAHDDYHFSVTVFTDQLAAVGCLRALAQFCQRTGNNRISWGGTKDEDWRQAGHKVTFRFSNPDYRLNFKAEATRILRENLFDIISENDDDPANPQS